MKYLDELARLKLPKEEYAIFGSGPLAIRGIRDNNDLDLIVTDYLWKKLSVQYLTKGKKIILPNVEICKDWLPWIEDTKPLIDDSEIIDGFPFVKLKYVLEWKLKSEKPKDKQDVKLIYDYLS
jgi:hypothetical protein